MSFADASAVVALDAGRFGAQVPPGWDIAGATNGGYLLALTARAAASAAGDRRPVTTTAHYLAPVGPGPAEIHTVVVRSGRRFTTVRAELVTEGRPALALLGAFAATDDDGPGPDLLVAGSPPDLPPPADCPPSVPTDTFPPPFVGRIEQRLHPDDAGFSSGRARTRGWFDLRDGEAIDGFALLLAADAFPPTIFNAGLPPAWTPTLELTVHVRGRPAPGPLACGFDTRFITGGLLECDGQLWDATGRLVAQSRQLALLPR